MKQVNIAENEEPRDRVLCIMKEAAKGKSSNYAGDLDEKDNVGLSSM